MVYHQRFGCVSFDEFAGCFIVIQEHYDSEEKEVSALNESATVAGYQVPIDPMDLIGECEACS